MRIVLFIISVDRSYKKHGYNSNVSKYTSVSKFGFYPERNKKNINLIRTICALTKMWKNKEERLLINIQLYTFFYERLKHI